MTPTGIEPATFRFLAQRLNHCATAVTEFCVRIKTKPSESRRTDRQVRILIFHLRSGREWKQLRSCSRYFSVVH